MRVDIVERFSPGSGRACSYAFSSDVTGPYDILHIGMENGKIFMYPIPAGQLPLMIRPIDITKDPSTQHGAEVCCLLFSDNAKFVHSQTSGLLFSGSLDRSIRVWSMSGGNTCSHVQTLFGHGSSITKIADGHDGSIVSCSEDGSLRMWTPQRGRNIMLHPFFECTFVMSFGREVWITALAVGLLGPWICYAADSNGNIDVLKKGSESNDVERAVASFTNQLTKSTRWEKVHNLGITHLELVGEENILVSLSYDTSCKVLDPSTGTALFQVTNRRRCMYTGVTWVKNMTSFYIVDEVGQLDVFNLYHERVVETTELVHQTAEQTAAVLKCHASQALRYISKFSLGGYYLSVVAKEVKNVMTLTSSSGKRLKSVGVIGDVILWNLSNDVNCKEFVGHDGSVVGIAVPTFSTAANVRTGVVMPATAAPIAPTASGKKPLLPMSPSFANVGARSMKALQQLQSSSPTNGKEDISRSNNNNNNNTNSTITGGGVMRASSLQISSEEKLFFSAGHEDDTIRCWDEYDQLESYQFKSKGTSEITVMLAVWHMNRIVTGHENGTVSIWNADTGARVSSNALKHTVSSLVEATSAHSKLLIGADYSGKIATWNLTLHFLNPTQLIHVGNDFDGFHTKEDPGIVSLEFHSRTMTMFSGGNDCYVRFWRLHSDVPSGGAKLHRESVTVMKCTGSFLLTGDEDGNLLLSRIVFSEKNPAMANTAAHSHSMGEGKKNNGMDKTASGNSSKLEYIAGLTILCAWNSYPVTMRGLGDLCELNLSGGAGSVENEALPAPGAGGPSSRSQKLRFGVEVGGGGQRILVTQVCPGGKSKMWEVWLQRRSVKPLKASSRSSRRRINFDPALHQLTAQLQQHDKGLEEGIKERQVSLLPPIPGAEAPAAVVSTAAAASAASDAHDRPQGVSFAKTSSIDGGGGGGGDMDTELLMAEPSAEMQGKYRIFDSLHQDLYISVSELYVLNHDKYDISCMSMSCLDWRSVEAFRASALVYMGTTAGLVFRFSFNRTGDGASGATPSTGNSAAIATAAEGVGKADGVGQEDGSAKQPSTGGKL